MPPDLQTRGHKKLRLLALQVLHTKLRKGWPCSTCNEDVNA